MAVWAVIGHPETQVCTELQTIPRMSRPRHPPPPPVVNATPRSRAVDRGSVGAGGRSGIWRGLGADRGKGLGVERSGIWRIWTKLPLHWCM